MLAKLLLSPAVLLYTLKALGYLLWQSFKINAISQCIVCMISIGVAGYISSEIIRLFGSFIARWQRQR